MRILFETATSHLKNNEDLALVTVIASSGATPRGAGAHMLVGESGRLYGTIGGGAVELRSIQLARALLAGQHVDALYDFKLSRDGELGMACGGDVTVLFTPARLSDRVWDALAAEVLRRFQPYAEALPLKAYFSSYRERLFVIGREVALVRGSAREMVQVLALNDDGSLHVRRADGSTKDVASGEVSLRF